MNKLFGKKEGDGAESSEKLITLDNGSSSTFKLSQLSKAISAAVSARKGNAEVSVILPSDSVVEVSSSIKLPASVNLVGNENSVVVLKEGGHFTTKSASSKLKNITFHLSSSKFAFDIAENGRIEIEDCIFGLEEGTKPGSVGFQVRGHLQIHGCQLNNWPIEATENGSVAADGTKFENVAGEALSFAISISNSGKPSELKNVEMVGYDTAVIVAGKSELKIVKSQIEAIATGVIADGSKLVVEESSISAPNGIGIQVMKEESSVEVTNCTFTRFKTGFMVHAKGKAILEACSFTGEGDIGIEAKEESSLTVSKTKITGMKEIGAQISFSIAKCSELEVEDCEGGGILVEKQGRLEGKGNKFKSNGGISMSFTGDSTGDVKETEITNAVIGVSVIESSYLQMYGPKIQNSKSVAIRCRDSPVYVKDGKFSNNDNGIGVECNFVLPGDTIAEFEDCLFNRFARGATIVEETGASARATTSVKNDVNPDEPFVVKCRCDLINCFFIKCKVGVHCDRAGCHLYGCTFASSTKHSIVIYNQFLRNVGQLRKEAKLKVRWPNYLESTLESSEALSNDKSMLDDVTLEKDFRMMQQFEMLLYREALTERIRQARNCFRSTDAMSLWQARVIMKSVSHVLRLIPKMRGDLLNQDLIDDPNLGMFSATFQLESSKRSRDNSLFPMEDLMESWNQLKRTKNFDDALSALNEAFNRKQVDEDLYDEWVTPLEEMQRVVYVNSKYNRRRDYLLETAKANPLSAWFFLVKEDRTKEEGKRLSEEVLFFIAADYLKYRVNNKDGFHNSWVSQWASSSLGSVLASSPIPENIDLRRAWGDRLLDDGLAMEMIGWYNNAGSSYRTEMDNLFRFEALKYIEDKHGSTDANQFKELQSIFGGHGSFDEPLKVAAKRFEGVGALPGILRRLAERANDVEALLTALSPVYQDETNPDGVMKLRTVLAVLSHFFNRDAVTAPKIVGKKEIGYETCPSCFVQKLQPWNELCLAECKHKHVFCRGCLKESMSQGNQDLWGICPGATDDGACTAKATRREMEMAGMEQERIFNILNVRIQKYLEAVEGWKSCKEQGCIGGRGHVTKGYYVCRLCEQMTIENGKDVDPTVQLKLLGGLDGSKAARGEGVFRECFHCASPYEKGNACSTITCANCRQQFSMTWGDQNLNHAFEDNGIGPQRYVPKKTGNLWKLGVFKNRSGQPLKLGQQLDDAEVAEVLRRAKQAANNLG